MKYLRRYKTPGTPGQGLVRVEENEKAVSNDEQTEYRSGVGMLLFLTKFSRPDISNAVRELSKMNDKACEGHVKELFRVIKFVLDTRYWSLRYRIERKDKNVTMWKVKAYSDSDFAGDKDTRLSICGYGIYLFDCLISWRSRAMRTHALSSTEAEYIAVSEVTCEILFIKYGKYINSTSTYPETDTEEDEDVSEIENGRNIIAENSATERPRTRSKGLATNENVHTEGSEKLRREMDKLHDTWNPTLDDVVEFILVGGSDDTYENPLTFQEAWNHPDKFECEMWREAIQKEFRDMI